MMLSGAEIIINVLLEQGVSTVFGYPGAMVLDIYDALFRCGRIRHILTSHEQGAAHAADGYARATGGTGVVIATSGPGATNLVTGIAAAYMDSVPLVAITGNVSTDRLGRDGFQETDIAGITMPVTKYNMIASDIDSLADDLRHCFKIANTGRKGPVLLDVPIDVLQKQAEYFFKEPEKPTAFSMTDDTEISKAVQLIESAERPLLYVGGGVISSNASEALFAFARQRSIPVACSMMGLGAFDCRNPLFVGMTGTHGNPAANEAMRCCDTLIAVGTRFCDRSAEILNYNSSIRIVHIDIDNAEINKNIRPDAAICGDARAALEAISVRMSTDVKGNWLEYLRSKKSELEVNACDEIPRRIIASVAKASDNNTVIATDVGQHQVWTAQYYPFMRPRSFLTSGGLGAMGYGLGAAIGARASKDDGKVVLISGDGSFHMNSNELATVAKYNLDIKIVIMNNGVLGMVRQWQWLRYGGRFSQTEPQRETDFVKLAKAYGIKGVRILPDAHLERKLSKALEKKGAVIIDCCVPSDASVFPFK